MMPNMPFGWFNTDCSPKIGPMMPKPRPYLGAPSSSTTASTNTRHADKKNKTKCETKTSKSWNARKRLGTQINIYCIRHVKAHYISYRIEYYITVYYLHFAQRALELESRTQIDQPDFSGDVKKCNRFGSRKIANWSDAVRFNSSKLTLSHSLRMNMCIYICRK